MPGKDSLRFAPILSAIAASASLLCSGPVMAAGQAERSRGGVTLLAQHPTPAGSRDSAVGRTSVRSAIGTAPPSTRSDLSICRDLLAGFAEQHEILFQSGSTVMTEASIASLDELAGDLNACPRTTIYVEGHTDADGSEAANLALSVARAEAVVEALTQRGVDASRLYAVGYGESLPIAPNDTPQGKRQNRRIVFTLEQRG